MEESNGIILLGLGPGEKSQLSLEAWDVIQGLSEIYLRTNEHPIANYFPEHLTVHSFDGLYERHPDFEDVYNQIIEDVLELGRRPEGVCYAVPGHPFVAEATSPEIARRAKIEGIRLRVVHGISFIEPALAAIDADMLPQTSIVDALDLLSQYHPTFPASFPAIVAQIYSTDIAAEVKLTLMAQYDDEHQVLLIHQAGTSKQIVENLPLHGIDKSLHIDIATTLIIPPIEEHSTLAEFQELIAHLRSPEGCPWDREQTHQSLRRNLLEETYEVLDALDANDASAMQEEFGDLLVQLILHAQIATEAGEFRMSDVIRGIHNKLVARHPHVFGDLELNDAESVINNWEHIKADERQAKGKGGIGSLDSVASALPALTQAEAYGSRAARVGFDWPAIEGVLDKVTEEINEIRMSENPKERESEYGDLLFSLVNYARWIDVDPEVALRMSNQKFKKRFGLIEKVALDRGIKIADMTLAQMEKIWESGKSLQD